MTAARPRSGALSEEAEPVVQAEETAAPLAGAVVTDILAVATREFAQHGLAGARIERIQAQTRTSKRMIYYHFGSKEGLYRAVLDHAFETVRAVDQGFDPDASSPEQALRSIARNAFTAFMRNPDFARLLTFENLAGAPYIRDSQQVARFNRKALQDMQRVLERGLHDGSFREEVQALDVYLNIVGLCYYHVAHQAAIRSGSLDASVTEGHLGTGFHQQRQRAIEEVTWRYVKADRF